METKERELLQNEEALAEELEEYEQENKNQVHAQTEKFREIKQALESDDEFDVQWAKEEAVKELEGLLYYIIRHRFGGYRDRMEDMISEGYLCILEDLHKYDPDAGSTPSSWYWFRIIEKISNYLHEGDAISEYYQGNQRKIQNAKETLEEHGATTTTLDLMIEGEMQKKTVVATEEYSNTSFVSLDDPDNNIVAKNTKSAELEAADNELKEVMAQALASLTERQQKIIMLSVLHKRSFKSIAKDLRASIVSIRSDYHKGINKMKKNPVFRKYYEMDRQEFERKNRLNRIVTARQMPTMRIVLKQNDYPELYL